MRGRSSLAATTEDAMTTIDRRAFLETAAALSALAALRPRPAAAAAGGLKKALYVSMLPKEAKDAAGAARALSYSERFRMALDAGFEGVEIGTITDAAVAAEIKEASAQTGLVIHSVMNADHWKLPLSSADPDVVAKSVAGMETSLRNAKLWGAGSVLLVPAVVDPETSYEAAWTRSQKVVKERLLPLAGELKVVIGMEEVWNKFLLSPLEMARYVDELASPWVKAYLDVGNMVFYGYPQDWIRTLGPRISRVHVKDFKLDRGKGQFSWKNLGEGDVDWPEVRKAFAEVGYDGWVTAEIEGGDAAYLKDVGARLDRFFAGQKPVA
jgi:L-ribulose-5-phosphate 3-epimerase